MSVIADASRASVTYPSTTGSAGGWPLVLYFHHVRADMDSYMAVTPAALEYALRLLAVRFRPFDPREVDGAVAGAPPRTPACLLTFDDGYLDSYEHAAPILEACGWHAVFFVSTELVGTIENDARRGKIEYMAWAQLAELEQRGHTIACHGATHRDMSAISGRGCLAEVAGAQAKLRRHLADPPNWLAFPYGRMPDPKLTAGVTAVGFGSVKARPKPWDDCPLAVRRTYLPTREPETWASHVEGWWRQHSRTSR